MLSPTFRGIVGPIGSKEPIVCYSLVRHEEDRHDMLRGSQHRGHPGTAEPAKQEGQFAIKPTDFHIAIPTWPLKPDFYGLRENVSVETGVC